MFTFIKIKGLMIHISFDGRIEDRRLRSIILATHFLVVRAIHKVLGQEFINNRDKYKVSFDIPTMVIASKLQVDLDKVVIKLLCRIFLNASYI